MEKLKNTCNPFALGDPEILAEMISKTKPISSDDIIELKKLKSVIDEDISIESKIKKIYNLAQKKAI